MVNSTLAPGLPTLQDPAMDEQAFLRILRDEPDNEEIRLRYWNWVEATGDQRAPLVRLMRERSQLREALKEIDARIGADESRWDDAWLDLAFPMRIRSPMVGWCYT